MNDIIKWAGKFCLHLIFWVFLLSIRWDGQTAFSYANNILVQNSFVQNLDEELADVWYRISETARVTFSESEMGEEAKM